MNWSFWKGIVFAGALGSSASAVAESNYQDWWWDPAQSGMGFNVGHQGETVVVAWYHYDADGSPAFMLLSGKLVNGVLQGNLERSAGPAPGSGYSSSAVQRSVPGTARIEFKSDSSATFTYSYDGKTGSIPLQRFSYGTPSILGRWNYAETFTQSGCTLPQNNGSGEGSGFAMLAGINGHYTMTIYFDAGGFCSHSINLVQSGSVFTGSGTFNCLNGISGSATVKNLRTVDDFLTLDYQLKVEQGETCNVAGKMGAVR